MLHVLLQIDAYDPVAAAPVVITAASHDDPAVCHANNGTWWPAIAKLPVLRYDFFDGAFGGEITSPSSSMSLQTEPWPNFARYSLADARFRLWTGDATVPGNVWTLRFDGRVSEQPQIENGVAQIQFGADDKFLDGSLLATYAGTTGAEGPAAMKGQAKPLALGAPRYVPGKLIDSINNVFQVSAYGTVQQTQVALERLVRFGSPLADYPDYASLIAASIPAGAWATANAAGMARFGAPTTGLVSFLLQGDAAGTDGWARKPGQLIRRLALLSGGAGKVDDASLNALDAARPYNQSLYLEEQTTARPQIQQIAASVNAVAGISWLGKLFVLPIALGLPTITLSADGSTLPPVASVQQTEVAAPFKSLAIGAERAWAQHSLNDIAFAANLLPLGAFSSLTIYREGNIVDLSNGSRFLYINTTLSAGHVPPAATYPPADPAGDAYWQQIAPPTIAVSTDGTPLTSLISDLSNIAAGKGRAWFQATPPSAAESSEQDIWFDTGNGNFMYRRVPGNGRIAFGGTVVTFPGYGAIVYAPWAPAPDQRIAQALADAAQAIQQAQAAQSTASAAVARLSAIDDDGILDRGEKTSILIPKAAALESSWAELDALAATYGVTTERTAANAKRSAWLAQLAAIAPAWNDDSVDSPVNRDTYQAALDQYEAALSALSKANVAAAGKHADYDLIAGTKPPTNADNTAQNQVIPTVPTSISVPADYTGAIAAGTLPKYAYPNVKRGGIDVTAADATTYLLSGFTGGCTTGNVTVDNTNGSTTKGRVSVAAGWTASGSVMLYISYAGTLVGAYPISVVLDRGPAPSGGGSGSSGYVKTGNFSAAGKAITSTSYVEIGKIPNMQKAAGETMYATFSGSYSVNSDGYAQVYAKWQYAPAGTSSWTDFPGGAATGTQASQVHNPGPPNTLPAPDDPPEWEIVSGSVTCNRTAAPTDGNYDLRLVVALVAAGNSVTFSDGTAVVEIKP